ncbi:MAG: carboxylating nicotinate-nucleotide diphosphorylase [Deltaproteobacteria bacterium]|nr:MAG: carboxylating nicotinate-nucleotide diphosphorylase [Deltaproteobacteria bacterium]
MPVALPFSPGVPALITLALSEDLHAGDVTSDAIFDEAHRSRAVLAAKEPAVLAGGAIFEAVFRAVDPGVVVTWEVPEGGSAERGAVLARLEGSTRSLLRAERTALNFLRHLCGIATMTRRWVEVLGPAGPRLLDTRKTTPGFRELEKYAVRTGGGCNHRYSLGSGAMIKDNHIAAAGSITAAVERVRAHAPFLLRIEVEVETLGELDEALAAGADAVLLDNMGEEAMREAVRRVGGRALTEASGNVTEDRLPGLRDIGLDFVSAGALTHSAPQSDLSLRVLVDGEGT